ncbi:hypothetical protein Nepgr_013587 [Nepenthes gracilis]|uniref:Uncharacterized protein n=1 Tax=Nepenthes gracilis TaxID=150966 RepID=A0AAD3XPH5_NEPGR|nr:hypothetical protein Nepgr_013587 [Nepenthes gracilis]
MVKLLAVLSLPSSDTKKGIRLLLLSPHDAHYAHHVKAPALEVDLDLTPNSITHLSSKYSLDAAGLVGPDTITPRGSLADVREGRALDAPRVESFQTSYRSAKDMIAISSNVVSALAVIRQMVICGKQLLGVECCRCSLC